VDEPEDDEEEDSIFNDDGSDVDDEEDDDDESVTEHGATCELEDYVDRLEKNGVTMMDIVSVWLNVHSKRNPKYTEEYVDELGDKMVQMVRDLEIETQERSDMEQEDLPAAEVVA